MSDTRLVRHISEQSRKTAPSANIEHQTAMDPHITGKSRLYGLVGDPLTAAKSPQLLNQLFAEQRVDAACVPFWVKAENLSAFVNGARAMGNLSGMLVTMPHKQRMLECVDELHPTARQVGDGISRVLRAPIRLERGTYKAMFLAILLASVFVIWVLGCVAHRIYTGRTAHHETFVIVGTGTRPLSWADQLADEAAAFLSGR